MIRTPIAASWVTAAAGFTPIMVRKLVSKLNVTITGNSGATSCAAFTAASTSPKSDIVSIRIASTPPATSPRICSANNSLPLSKVRVPIGSIRSPEGPISPMTKTPGWRSATLRAIAAPALFNSSTRLSSPWIRRRPRVPPKVLVVMKDAPALA